MSLEKALELLGVSSDMQFEEDNIRMSLITTRLTIREIIDYLQSSPTKEK